MHVEIDERQRAEILTALMERKATIAKYVKDLTKDSMPEEAAMTERRLALYATDDDRVGLLAMFALTPDLDEERAKRKQEEKRDPDGQQDIFGGGAATGGGHPAGETGFPDKRGNLHPTQEEADAADAASDDAPASGDEDLPGGVLPFRQLGSGKPSDVDDAEIVEDGTGDEEGDILHGGGGDDLDDEDDEDDLDDDDDDDAPLPGEEAGHQQ